MELHERLVTNNKQTAGAPRPTKEPFAELKNSIHMLVIGELGPQLTGQTIDPVGMRDRVLADIRRHLSSETGISRDDRERLTSEIADDILGYGPLERLLADDSITEIMVNGPGEIWIERQGRLYETTVRFNDESHLRRIINRMVAQIGRRIDESSPMVDARLPDGSRVNAIIAPLSLSGPILTIRKFAKKRLGLQDMVNLGSLNEESIDFLRRCIQAQLNVLISGGTGSWVRRCSCVRLRILHHERIVTIEDAAELQLHQRHVLRLEARPPTQGQGPDRSPRRPARRRPAAAPDHPRRPPGHRRRDRGRRARGRDAGPTRARRRPMPAPGGRGPGPGDRGRRCGHAGQAQGPRRRRPSRARLRRPRSPRRAPAPSRRR